MLINAVDVVVAAAAAAAITIVDAIPSDVNIFYISIDPVLLAKFKLAVRKKTTTNEKRIERSGRSYTAYFMANEGRNV